MESGQIDRYMPRYFVLWTNAAGRMWDGPYKSFKEAARSEHMQDAAYRGFVTYIQGEGSHVRPGSEVAQVRTEV